MKKIVAVLIVIMAGITVYGQNFTSHELYTSSQRLFFVIGADLNKDGKTDILFAEPSSPVLCWFKNIGNGNFVKDTIGNYSGATSVFVCDINNDSINDVLVCSYNASNITAFINTGDEYFISESINSSLVHPLMVVANDIDGDGDVDIACATQDAGTGIEVLTNNNNVFIPKQLSTGVVSSTQVNISDLDKDGDLDIVGNRFDATGGILWYEQTDTMVFIEHTLSFPYAHGFDVGYINSDSLLDIAVVSCGSRVGWFRNDGNNSFTKLENDPPYSCAVAIAIGHLNFDNTNDLVAAAWSANKIGLWYNNGNESFSYSLLSNSLVNPNSLYIADFNNDNANDIVVVSYSGKLIWYENTLSTPVSNYISSAINIFYNPSLSEIKIQNSCTNNKAVVIDIYNTWGQKVLSKTGCGPDFTIPFDKYSSGVYIVNTLSGNQHNTLKFTHIKNK